MGGVTGEVVSRPEQEVDGGLKLSSQEQDLEVEDRLGTGREMSFTWNRKISFIKVVFSDEMCFITVFFAHERLETGKSETVSASIVSDQTQFEPEIVVKTGHNLRVLVVNVRSSEDAVDGSLVWVSGLSAISPVLQPHL